MTERPWTKRVAGLLAAFTIGLGGCAGPQQTGELVVLPGAAERLMLAMSLGYGGAGDAKRPARVWRIGFAEDQMKGKAATGRIGDYLLENKRVSVVIANADGSDRGGQIVDMARAPHRVDDLGKLETVVSNMRVRYRTVTTGTDPQLGTAFVNVVGYAERDPSMEIATRYDIGPELDMVLIHTTIKPGGRAFVGPIAVGDALVLPGVYFGESHAAAFGEASGYVLKPLGEGALAMLGAVSRAAIGQSPESIAAEEYILYSRALIALERPDSLAMATALAEVNGKPTGEIELEVVARAKSSQASLAGGQFLLRSSSAGEGLAIHVEQPLYPGDRLLARAPVGQYLVGYEGAGRRTRTPAKVDVRARVRTPVRIDAPAGAPPEQAPDAPPAAPDPELASKNPGAALRPDRAERDFSGVWGAEPPMLDV